MRSRKSSCRRGFQLPDRSNPTSGMNSPTTPCPNAQTLTKAAMGNTNERITVSRFTSTLLKTQNEPVVCNRCGVSNNAQVTGRLPATDGQCKNYCNSENVRV